MNIGINMFENNLRNVTFTPKRAIEWNGSENKLLSSIFSHFVESSDELFRHQIENGVIEIYVMQPSTNRDDYTSAFLDVIAKLLDNAYINHEIKEPPRKTGSQVGSTLHDIVWVIKVHKERGVENLFAFDRQYLANSDPGLAELLEDPECKCVRLF